MFPSRPSRTAAVTAVAMLACFGPAAGRLLGQGPANILVVANDNSPLSRSVAEYYARRREIPARNLCHIRASQEEEIARPQYDQQIAAPIAACLRERRLTEQVLYIATTAGVPLRIAGSGGMGGDIAAVDSELTLLYTDMHQGRAHALNGFVPNPWFRKGDRKFAHPEFPIYLVTRLAAYDFDGVKGIIDRALQAANRGKFVIDMKSGTDQEGNDWLRNTAILLPKERVVLDQSTDVLYGQTGVIAYASWGSNDPNRHRRFLDFKWLPGAIATELVSTDGRSFRKPPNDWNISDWNSPKLWFAGSPQTMTADFLLEGATGASGHIAEPYLPLTPHPEIVLPAYYSGRNLAESFYLGIAGLSWQNIVVGDPLCSLGPPVK